jgi:hypothetical protein
MREECPEWQRKIFIAPGSDASIVPAKKGSRGVLRLDTGTEKPLPVASCLMRALTIMRQLAVVDG